MNAEKKENKITNNDLLAAIESLEEQVKSLKATIAKRSNETKPGGNP